MATGRPAYRSVTFTLRNPEVKRLLEKGKEVFDNGRINEAIDYYQQALLLDPDCALIHFNLGFAYHELGNYPAAKEYYEKAIKLDAECSFFMEHLGKLYFDLADHPSAIEMFKRAEKLGTLQPTSYGLLGKAYYHCGRYRSAIYSLSRMVDLETDDTLQCLARHPLILACLKVGDIFRARRESYYILDYPQVYPRILLDLSERFLSEHCYTLSRNFLEKIQNYQEEFSRIQQRLEQLRAAERRIDELIPALYYSEEEDILRTMHILLRFGSEKISRAFLSLLPSQSPLIRETIIEYHRRYGFEVAVQIVDLLNDEVTFVREKCAEYFTAFGLPGYEDRLKLALKDNSSVVRNFATIYLKEADKRKKLANKTNLKQEEDPLQINTSINFSDADKVNTAPQVFAYISSIKRMKVLLDFLTQIPWQKVFFIAFVVWLIVLILLVN